ncbi:MAG: hypothetical protein UX92_C0012G0031 [Candidatus Amesbacteria bacterium GW2011_GWA1_47_20]|uniref:Uncharacterized protein n=2 Tax=Candidatus Amesiibacteriota TaxID=1752730 RepID=A0A0G1UUI6_9BACT|nr:MAG: hypothetical protein UX42_C0008G0008 [Microgenomates group bacterium GW2011_GWC1_46_20]KKU69688.1 MAG: hypothetical protein UX92_C0012G0031 [Candidatus Amesbacteria bacterium GW2011_GWA1_47_20]KKU83291.1 MAG: hypothetical protein UY11_C0023G0009 [Candidatus Amesbacteria bacterium GW2011_GWC2_47_8]
MGRLYYSSTRRVVKGPEQGLMKSRYLVVEVRRLWPTIWDRYWGSQPAESWWAMKVWRRSLTLVPLTSATLKNLSMAVLMFLINKGWPVLVTKRWGSVTEGRMAR